MTFLSLLSANGNRPSIFYQLLLIDVSKSRKCKETSVLLQPKILRELFTAAAIWNSCQLQKDTFAFIKMTACINVCWAKLTDWLLCLVNSDPRHSSTFLFAVFAPLIDCSNKRKVTTTVLSSDPGRWFGELMPATIKINIPFDSTVIKISGAHSTSGATPIWWDFGAVNQK